MVTCENGHQNPEKRRFCGDCGIPIVPMTAICVHGHVNAEDQQFCGDCGVPVRGPVAGVPGSPAGRWNTDPSGDHQHRYWDGRKWTEHVADSGTFSTDPFRKGAQWHPETWVGVAAGVVTLVLVVGAIIGIAIQLSGDAEPTNTTQSPLATVAASAPPAAPAPSRIPWVRAVAVIGTSCLPRSSTSLTADGSVAYCERLQSADTYMWSLFPGDIGLPISVDLSQQDDPAVAVCMAQTDRSAPQCIEYLQRPSDPGDGRPGT